MNRNKALTQLAPNDLVLVEANALGSLFCNETFKFVLAPCTRRAAERIARWHGCRFEFHELRAAAASKARQGDGLCTRFGRIRRPANGAPGSRSGTCSRRNAGLAYGFATGEPRSSPVVSQTSRTAIAYLVEPRAKGRQRTD